MIIVDRSFLVSVPVAEATEVHHPNKSVVVVVMRLSRLNQIIILEPFKAVVGKGFDGLA